MSDHRNEAIPPNLSDLHTDGEYQPRHRAVPCRHCGLGRHRHEPTYGWCTEPAGFQYRPEMAPRPGSEFGPLRNFQAEVIFTVEVDPAAQLNYLCDPDASLEDQVHAMIVDLLSTYVTPRTQVTNNRALTIHWEMFEGAVGEVGPHGVGT